MDSRESLVWNLIARYAALSPQRRNSQLREGLAWQCVLEWVLLPEMLSLRAASASAAGLVQLFAQNETAALSEEIQLREQRLRWMRVVAMPELARPRQPLPGRSRGGPGTGRGHALASTQGPEGGEPRRPAGGK